jgi:hypothetical protein
MVSVESTVAIEKNTSLSGPAKMAGCQSVDSRGGGF